MKQEYLEEIWRIREQMAARFDYDVDRLLDHLEREQTKLGNRLVAAPPKKTRHIRQRPVAAR